MNNLSPEEIEALVTKIEAASLKGANACKAWVKAFAQHSKDEEYFRTEFQTAHNTKWELIRELNPTAEQLKAFLAKP